MANPWESFSASAAGSGGAPWESFEASIDKTRGAPASVRERVGGAAPQDRLANIQQFYPDAQPYGDNNFVFTDPETGAPTVYNPSGFDAGDVASVAREGTQAVASTLGAVAGGFAALPTGPGAIGGAVVGAGLGNALGGALYDAAATWIGGRINTRDSADLMIGTVVDVAIGAVGQRVGEVVGAGVKSAVAGSTTQAASLLAAFQRLGITAPASAVSTSNSTRTVAKALESSPFSADVMQKQAETVIRETHAAVDSIVSRFGQAQTKQGAGAVIKEAANAAGERFGFRQASLYDDAFNLIGADSPVGVGSVTALRAELMGELARAPQSLAKTLEPAIRQLDALVDDAANGGLPFDALRQIRTAIGKDLAAPMLAGATSAQNTTMKRVYGALTEDMTAAARQAGPDAAKALAVADRYTRAFMTSSAKALDKITKFDADERAFDFAMTAARDGGSGLARLRRNFLPEEWDTVAASVLARMGRALPGAQNAGGEVFSVSTFLTNWNRLAPEAKTALFGGKRYADLAPAMDDLLRVVSELKDVEKLTNTSNTARAMVTLATLGTIGSSAGAALTGSVEGAGAGVVTLLGTAMTSRAAAKLMTSPSFVRWMASAPGTTGEISAHFGRLESIAQAEPWIEEEIYQYMQSLRPAPQQAN